MKPRYSKFAKITNCNRISCFFFLLVCLFACLFVCFFFFFIFIVRNTSHLEQLKLVQHKRQISIPACIKKNSFCKQLRENVIKDFAPLRFAPVATNIHAPPTNKFLPPDCVVCCFFLSSCACTLLFCVRLGSYT